MFNNKSEIDKFQKQHNKKIAKFVKENGMEAKYQAIDDAVRVLTEAGIPSYLFVEIEHFSSPKETVVVQYNNIKELDKTETLFYNNMKKFADSIRSLIEGLVETVFGKGIPFHQLFPLWVYWLAELDTKSPDSINESTDKFVKNINKEIRSQTATSNLPEQ